jgi:hypothetical protein
MNFSPIEHTGGKAIIFTERNYGKLKISGFPGRSRGMTVGGMDSLVEAGE